MKMKTLVAAAGMIAAQSALAVDGATEQRLIEKGFLPEPVQGAEIVRGVPAEPEHRAEAQRVAAKHGSRKKTRRPRAGKKTDQVKTSQQLLDV